jgi:hypothetical protein
LHLLVHGEVLALVEDLSVLRGERREVLERVDVALAWSTDTFLGISPFNGFLTAGAPFAPVATADPLELEASVRWARYGLSMGAGVDGLERLGGGDDMARV